MNASISRKAPLAPHNGGEDYYGAFLGALNNLSGEFSRKLDESERDTRKQLDNFNTSVSNQFQNITSKFESAMAARDAKFEAFSTKVLEGGRAQWPLILLAVSVGIAILGALGGLAYAPIASGIGDLKATIDKLADNQIAMRDFTVSNFVTQKDLDARAERGAEDRARTARTIEGIQANIFTRDVHQEHWRNIDTSIAATNLRVDTTRQDLQRQIDQLQQNLGDTFTARDALLENKERIGKLEDLVRLLTSSVRGGNSNSGALP